MRLDTLREPLPLRHRRQPEPAWFLTICVCALPFSLAAQNTGAKPEAPAALSSVKQAMGGARWDTLGSLHFRGTAHIGALEGSFESWVDLQHGYWWSEKQLAGAATARGREVEGWNGKVAWSSDRTGDVLIGESEEARARAIGESFNVAFGLLFPKRFPAAIRLGPAGNVDGKQYTVIQAHPRGADPIELWVGATTRLIERVRQMTGVDKGTTVFSDFRVVDGVTLPFIWRDLGTNPGEVIERIDIASVEVGKALPAGIFNPPASTPPSLEFPPGQSSVTVNFDFTGDDIGFPVSINGMPAEMFGFDTGSTNTITTSWARAKGLRFDAAGVGWGGGDGEAAEGMATVNRIEIGGLRITGQDVSVSDLPMDAWRGTLGYELARSTVVQIDYASRRITFFKPDSFQRPANAVALPLRFASNSEPLVEATIEGCRGEFQIDTGQAIALTVNRPFAQRNGLMAKYGKGVKTMVEGIGGQGESVEFAPAMFTLGGLEPSVESALILLSDTGSAAEEHVAGGIGNAILKQFTVTLDYQHRVAYFQKNEAFGMPADTPTESSDRPTFDADSSPGGVKLPKSGSPTPTAQSLLARAIAVENAQAARRERFTYREDDETSPVDKNGKALAPSRRTYDNIMLEGEIYRKLILIDGAAPGAKLQKQIDEEMEKERAARRAHPKQTGKRMVTMGSLDQIARMCESKVTGQEDVSGRPAWRVESIPKAGYKPADHEEEKFLNVRRVTWFDVEEGAAVKFREVFFRPTEGVLPGSQIEFVFGKHGDAWLWDSWDIRENYKALGIFRLKSVVHIRYYDFKRFNVESTIKIQ
jgi:hypothetical protein